MGKFELKTPKMHLYVHLDGKKQGPFTTEELGTLLENKAVNLGTPLWYERLDGWATVGDIPQFNRRTSTPPPDHIPKNIPPGQIWVCPRGKPGQASIEQAKVLIQQTKLRRGDYVFLQEDRRWVRADQHPLLREHYWPDALGKIKQKRALRFRFLDWMRKHFDS